MTRYSVITIPGIGEPKSIDGRPVGMLANITSHLDPAVFEARQFDWSNSYGPVPTWDGAAYQTNLNAAKDDLGRVFTDSRDPVVAIGYSGGAHLLSLTAPLAANLALIVMVSNPSRREGDSEAPFYGVTGQHDDFPAPLIDIANPADVICCCPPKLPIRGFSDLTKRFSLADPITWGRSLAVEVVTNQVQGSLRRAGVKDWAAAAAYARGYLIDQQHTGWYVPRLPEVAAQITQMLAPTAVSRVD